MKEMLGLAAEGESDADETDVDQTDAGPRDLLKHSPLYTSTQNDVVTAAAGDDDVTAAAGDDDVTVPASQGLASLLNIDLSVRADGMPASFGVDLDMAFSSDDDGGGGGGDNDDADAAGKSSFSLDAVTKSLDESMAHDDLWRQLGITGDSQQVRAVTTDGAMQPGSDIVDTQQDMFASDNENAGGVTSSGDNTMAQLWSMLQLNEPSS